MITGKTRNGDVIIYAETIEGAAVDQVMRMAESPLGENAHIRIMPDAHSGMGCVIGTTMRITDKVCPNLVGVDIGCGVALAECDAEFGFMLGDLDEAIRKRVPFGMRSHNHPAEYFELPHLRCWTQLTSRNRELAMQSLGTLGGGNHFIEAYAGGFLAVHSGSRNIGNVVARHYQALAEKHIAELNQKSLNKAMLEVEPKNRSEYLARNRIAIDRELAYLTGELMADYLHDIKILQRFAEANRWAIIDAITEELGVGVMDYTECIHNYIDTSNMILRKGAISAQEGETILIPLNMRDGMLICKGKGNAEWNFSAPHGAGRLYSRKAAKEAFSLAEYEKTMDGIYSSCVNAETLDEAPFAYKNMDEIMRCIEPTASIEKRLIPTFNFKASDV